MRKAIILATLLLAGCEFHRPAGSCIGLLDKEKPGVEYDASGRNIVVGAIFVGSVWVPAYVILKDYKCPIGVAK